MPSVSQESTQFFVKEIEDFVGKNREKFHYALYLLLIAKLTFDSHPKKTEKMDIFCKKIADSLIDGKDKKLALASAFKNGLNLTEVGSEFREVIDNTLITYIKFDTRENYLSYGEVIIKLFSKINEIIKSKDDIDLNNNIFIKPRSVSLLEDDQAYDKFLKKRIHKSEADENKELENVKTRLNKNPYWMSIYQNLTASQKSKDKLLRKMEANSGYYLLFVIALVYFGYEFFNAFGPKFGVATASITAVSNFFSPSLLILAFGGAVVLLALRPIVNAFSKKFALASIKSLHKISIALSDAAFEIKIDYQPAQQNALDRKSEVKSEIAIRLVSRAEEASKSDKTLENSGSNPYNRPEFGATTTPDGLKEKVKTRGMPHGSSSTHSKNPAEDKLEPITWRIAALDIVIKVKWNPKTNEVFADTPALEPLPIRRVTTKDNKILFLYVPDATILAIENPAVKNAFLAIVNFPAEKELRKFTDGRTRQGILTYGTKNLSVLLDREIIASTLDKRIFGFDNIAENGNEILTFAPFFGDGLHNSAKLQKESFGKVKLEDHDINKITAGALNDRTTEASLTM